MRKLTLLMGGKGRDSALTDGGSRPRLRPGRRKIPVKRQMLGPQSVLLRPRWDWPADAAQVLPPLVIA